MLNKRLARDFFNRDTITVSKDLLGKIIFRKYKNRNIGGIITETEAYIGPKDKASHAYNNKKTKRNLAEYFDGGHIYIYLVYGMYWQLNFSTAGENLPECVLIRAVVPTNNSIVEKNRFNLANGPGKLCKYFKFDKSFYGEDICNSKRVSIKDAGIKVPEGKIGKGPRIGIDYAGPYWARRHWRFWINPDLLPDLL